MAAPLPSRHHSYRLLATVHRWAWWPRAVTLGVRAVAVGEAGVLLVRHTYVAGWYLPGGGVDRGESAEAAAVRELTEEGGLRATERLRLHGLFANGRHDHVACFVLRRFTRCDPPATAVREIAEAAFFPPDALPPDTTRATRARIAEVLHGAPVDDRW